jgi:hypothetical protein
VGPGATVSVYVEAPLCAGAKKEQLAKGGRAGKLRVRVVCLAPVERGGGVDLAAAGANARRATEDSSTVGYIGEPDSAAARFSRPILESVGIAQIYGSSGSAAMAKLLQAIRRAGGSGSLRESVRNELR